MHVLNDVSVAHDRHSWLAGSFSNTKGNRWLSNSAKLTLIYMNFIVSIAIAESGRDRAHVVAPGRA